MARAPVSKTGGWGFESLHSCQACAATLVRERHIYSVHRGLRPTPLWAAAGIMAKFNPFQFMQEVRTEAQKVTWPTRRETMITTAMVFVMVVITSVFFLLADQIMRLVVTTVLSIGG
jgi:preprotein translocase subunit SecE